MNIETITSAVILMGLFGGWIYFIELLYKMIDSIIKHFSWREIKLTNEEFEKLVEANRREKSTKEAMNEIARKRNVHWDDVTFNLITRKVRIR